MYVTFITILYILINLVHNHSWHKEIWKIRTATLRCITGKSLGNNERVQQKLRRDLLKYGFLIFSTVSLFFLDPSSPLKVNCKIFPRAQWVTFRKTKTIYSKQFVWPNKRSDSPIRFRLDNGCPTLLSIALINTVTKNNFGKKGLFWLIHLEGSQSSREVMAWTQVRNLKAGLSWVHWWMLLISSSPWLAQFYFLIRLRTSCPGSVPPTASWALPHQSLIEKMPHNFLTGQVEGGIFSTEVPPFQMTLDYVIDKKSTSTTLGWWSVLGKSYIMILCLSPPEDSNDDIRKMSFRLCRHEPFTSKASLE